MLYLLAALFLLILSVVLSCKQMVFGIGRGSPRVPNVLIGFFTVICAFLVAAPLYYAILLNIQFTSGGGVPGTASMKFAIYLALAGASLSFAWYGYRALRLRGHMDIVAVVVCGYLAFTALNHLTFFADKAAGVADLSFFVESGAVTDIDDCGPVVLVRGAVDGGAVRYRCPHDVALGMGLVSDPFVPWPSYTAGESKELGSALSALWENAAKPYRN